MRNYGYACINQGFSSLPKSQRITTNRTMIKRTFQERGIDYASELALQNLRDLRKILEWNLENNIYFYRLSSDIVPWASEYDLIDMPNSSILIDAPNHKNFNELAHLASNRTLWRKHIRKIDNYNSKSTLIPRRYVINTHLT